ncbi:Leucine rich repeat proteins some proteins containing F-box protein [Dioscorea alata]|uniref:Leucine rich repeat proteins some proteins containing F-box protein n=1 Tax=Dioscorea alata TaxID=55571 RepID=A0ACB7WKG0_DIOAL|nr:Leucine rich repeat proteins some proteins containing F-box protein [Dioscorea alata]
MERLPESLLMEIFRRIDKTSDRNSLSRRTEEFLLRVGCGLHPATEALTSLCIRFPNLKKIEIIYSGWMSNLGKQLDNQGLLVISSHCHSLSELTVSFCSFINDTGLGYLVSCKNLMSFKLNFAPAISSNGILSLVVGCKKLNTLHLIRCMKVSSVEWLEYLGRVGTLEDLVIKNCRAIGEGDLTKLGLGWRKLKHLEFEVDAYYRYLKICKNISVDRWLKQEVSCDKLKELSLMNCIIASGRGLSFVLGKCRSLERLHLDMCIGVKDADMAALSQCSKNLKCLSLHLPSQFFAPVLVNSPSQMTDDSLRALAQGCSILEEVELCFSDGEFPSISCFTQNGILALIESCPIRVLVLNSCCFFNDVDHLELVKCQEITDEGIMLVVSFPYLNTLKLCKCLGVTDDGLKPLVGSGKLGTLIVEGCPQISEDGVQGTARPVSYKQDLSWLY